MAINVNTVYQTVLSILNKEQRGLLTPEEFNNIGTQVQLEIYDSYFPDGDQANRKNQANQQNDTEWFNTFDNIEYKIEPFIVNEQWQQPLGESYWTLPTTNLGGRSVRHVGNVSATYRNQGGVNTPATAWVQDSRCDKITYKDYQYITKSPLTQPDQQNPVYYFSSTQDNIDNNLINPVLNIYPNPSTVTSEVLLGPKDVAWNYTVGALGQYEYAANGSVDFDLSTSEQNEVILRILAYAGIIIKDPQIIQAASAQVQAETANEKA
tara:strand:+ start:4707 stop:5504 length:798 start_codon:yes stop_codon:yes gene_type:complete